MFYWLYEVALVLGSNIYTSIKLIFFSLYASLGVKSFIEMGHLISIIVSNKSTWGAAKYGRFKSTNSPASFTLHAYSFSNY